MHLLRPNDTSTNAQSAFWLPGGSGYLINNIIIYFIPKSRRICKADKHNVRQNWFFVKTDKNKNDRNFILKVGWQTPKKGIIYSQLEKANLRIFCVNQGEYYESAFRQGRNWIYNSEHRNRWRRAGCIPLFARMLQRRAHNGCFSSQGRLRGFD